MDVDDEWRRPRQQHVIGDVNWVGRSGWNGRRVSWIERRIFEAAKKKKAEEEKLRTDPSRIMEVVIDKKVDDKIDKALTAIKNGTDTADDLDTDSSTEEAPPGCEELCVALASSKNGRSPGDARGPNSQNASTTTSGGSGNGTSWKAHGAVPWRKHWSGAKKTGKGRQWDNGKGGGLKGGSRGSY